MFVIPKEEEGRRFISFMTTTQYVVCVLDFFLTVVVRTHDADNIMHILAENDQ